MDRRAFLGTAAAGATAVSLQGAEPPIRLGVVTRVRAGQTPDSTIARVKRLGLSTCQIGVQPMTLADVPALKAALTRHGVEATAVMELGPGKMVWDFYQGPSTIGVVPRETRRARIEALKAAADFAEAAGVASVQTHIGFVPEFPGDPLFAEVVTAVTEIAAHFKTKGRTLLLETGQESPVTLLRLIETVGTGNLFINLDTANLILYGKGNPVDAMDVIGKYVRGMHAKDGLFPTDPKNLGREVPIGKGRVDFRALLLKLKAVNYHGPMTIEREIEGARQEQDILDSKKYLEGLIAEVFG